MIPKLAGLKMPVTTQEGRPAAGADQFPVVRNELYNHRGIDCDHARFFWLSLLRAHYRIAFRFCRPILVFRSNLHASVHRS